MPSHHPHPTASRYRVLVTDHITPELATGDGRHYESPPQTEHQARALLAVLVGAEHRDHPGPWRQAIAGGQRIIELHGRPMTSPTEDLDRYLQIIAGATPTGRLIEIRATTPHGAIRQTFTPATRPDLAARTITRLAAHADVYVGVLLRRRRAGGRHACERSHLAFIEIDSPDALQRLQQHACPPSLVIASGGTPGHAHAYWRLQQPVDLDTLEHANRRLAHHLGGDPASTDGSRILRPPSSWNRKRTPPTRVELLLLEPARRYPLAQLTAGLTDPATVNHPHRPRRNQPARSAAARHPGRHLREGAHRPPTQPSRQNLLPVSRRPQPQPAALRLRLVLLRLPRRRDDLRLRRAALRAQHPRSSVPRAPPTLSQRNGTAPQPPAARR